MSSTDLAENRPDHLVCQAVRFCLKDQFRLRNLIFEGSTSLLNLLLSPAARLCNRLRTGFESFLTTGFLRSEYCQSCFA